MAAATRCRPDAGARRPRLEIDAEVLRHDAVEEGDRRRGGATAALASAFAGLHLSLRLGHVSPHRRRRAAGAGGGRGAVLQESERFQRAADRVDLGLGFGQFADGRDLAQRQRLHAELRIRQRLKPIGTREMGVFRAQAD